MLMHFLAITCKHFPGKAVRIRVATGERDRRVHPVPRLGAQDGPCAQAPVPGKHVLDRQIQRAVRGRVLFRGYPLLVGQVPIQQPVACGPVRYDGGFVDQARTFHAQRLKDPVTKHLAVVASAQAIQDRPEQQVAGVAVAVALPGLKLERLRTGHAYQLAFRKRATGVVTRLIAVIPDPRGVGEQVADTDGRPLRRRFGQKSRNGIVERKPAILDEQHHRRRRKLLADRARLENRVGDHRSAMLDVGVSVTLGKNHLAVVHYSDREPRDLLGTHLLANHRFRVGQAPEVHARAWDHGDCGSGGT